MVKKILLISFSILLIISCQKDIDSSFYEEKFADFSEENSIITDRIQFGTDKIIYFKIATENNYIPGEGFSVQSILKNGSDSVRIDLYDDGITDGILRNDLAASNGIWSGGVKSDQFLTAGEWDLEIVFMLENVVLDRFDGGIVYVVDNKHPVIDNVKGLESSMIFESGFETKQIEVAVTDSNNFEPPFDEQILALELFDGSDNLLRSDSYTRIDQNENFIFSIDSTFAAGVTYSRVYKLRLTATDMYNESHFQEFDRLTIDNTAPTIYELDYPDTVFIPDTDGIPGTDSLYFGVKVKVNDPQGYLESEDVDIVLITIPSLNWSYEMRDDGDYYTSGDNLADDGVYTISFWVRDDNAEAVYPFSITATDKADNSSNILTGTLIFVKDSKKKNIRRQDETKFTYIDPFNFK